MALLSSRLSHHSPGLNPNLCGRTLDQIQALLYPVRLELSAGFEVFPQERRSVEDEPQGLPEVTILPAVQPQRLGTGVGTGPVRESQVLTRLRLVS
jgi:hypothetical protein